LQITSNTGADTKSFYGANFTATWQYPQRDGQPVHAFPNALLNDTHLPLKVGDMQSLELDVGYSYAPGDLPVAPAAVNAADLTAAGLNANVALDMFYDLDQTIAAKPDKAKIEVMIWLGMFGRSAQPIGYNDGQGTIAATYTINGTKL
jgi:Glycosyl hydrolase family 12